MLYAKVMKMSHKTKFFLHETAFFYFFGRKALIISDLCAKKKSHGF